MTASPDTITSAQTLFDTAPLGAIVRFSDGEPEPPARFKRKRETWANTNGTGQLIEKHPGSDRYPATFKLHIGNLTVGHVTVMRSYRSYRVDTALSFAIESSPAPGSVCILKKTSICPELLHIAPDQSAADDWLAANPDSDAYCETVPQPA